MKVQHSSILDYLIVLKPKETSLLVYICICTASLAAHFVYPNFPIKDFILTIMAVTLGIAGANGMTNYLDRDVDAKMQRTCGRPLPAERIKPAHNVLPMLVVLIFISLLLAWILSPVCLIIGLIGVIASVTLRKTISCTFLGIIAGSSPILISWYAITKSTSVEVIPLLLLLQIAFWTPVHVWALMISYRSDYENAGLKYFPLSWKDANVIKLLFVLSLALFGTAISFYFLTNVFHWLYLSVAVILGLVMIIANLMLLFDPVSKNSWRIYKLSAFPFLGIIYTFMVLDIWLI